MEGLEGFSERDIAVAQVALLAAVVIMAAAFFKLFYHHWSSSKLRAREKSLGESLKLLAMELVRASLHSAVDGRHLGFGHGYLISLSANSGHPQAHWLTVSVNLQNGPGAGICIIGHSEDGRKLGTFIFLATEEGVAGAKEVMTKLIKARLIIDGRYRRD